MRQLESKVVENLRLLIGHLMNGEKNRLNEMGRERITSALLADYSNVLFERKVLAALEECDFENMPPTVEHVALLMRQLDDNTITRLKEIAALAEGQTAHVRGITLFLYTMIETDRLKAAGEQALKTLSTPNLDLTAQHDQAMMQLLNAKPPADNQIMTELEAWDDYLSDYKVRNERKKQGLAVGGTFPLARMRELVPVLGEGDMTLVTGEPKIGKAQPLDALVVTPDGLRPIGSIRVGEFVTTPLGISTQVIGTFPQGRKPIYRVTFNDGSFTECCDEHLWYAQDRSGRKWGVRPLKNMMHNLRADCGYRWRIPVTAPVNFSNRRHCPIDAYVLGAILGDGGLTNTSVYISSEDQDLLDEITRRLPKGVELKHVDRCNWRFSTKSRVSPLTQALRELELMGKPANAKHIPQEYIFTSIANRILLLQGLMDTDGCPTANGASVEYTTVSSQLAHDVTLLVQSLGGIVHTTTRIPRYSYAVEMHSGQLSYRLNIVLPYGIQPFKLRRKAALYTGRLTKPLRRSIIDVQYVGEKEAVRIKVAHPINFISPTISLLPTIPPS